MNNIAIQKKQAVCAVSATNGRHSWYTWADAEAQVHTTILALSFAQTSPS
jgi:hypothetical protein